MTTTTKKATITIRATISAPVEKVWTLWTNPKHIVHWNKASDEWHTPTSQNDLRVGGTFLSRMEAKDGSQGFDFAGEYSKIIYHKQIEYVLADGRKVFVFFVSNRNETTVTETFEPEQTYPVEFQETGWQAILNNFKKYVEAYCKDGPMIFKISINANIKQVYKTMLNAKSYAEWTSEFNPNSHYVGSWKKGSKILFLGRDDEGHLGGMVSRIKENIPNKLIIIEHLGIVQNGKELITGSDVDTWAGAIESYSFVDDNGKTKLSINLETLREISDEFKFYFSETWPKALKKLKAICESK